MKLNNLKDKVVKGVKTAVEFVSDHKKEVCHGAAVLVGSYLLGKVVGQGIALDIYDEVAEQVVEKVRNGEIIISALNTETGLYEAITLESVGL